MPHGETPSPGPSSRFVHLNVHSCFSLMRGVPWPAELCEAAKAAGMDSLALTDTDGLYGLVWFLEEARVRGVSPIVGAEVTDPGSPARAVVLVKRREGYPALCRLLTARHVDPGFSLARALRDAEGSLAILSDDHEVLSALEGRPDAYCEIRRPQGSHALSRWALSRGIPAAATGDVHLLHPGQHPLHRLLRAVDTNTTLRNVPARELAPESAWFKTEALIRQDLPHLPEAVENAICLAGECEKEWSFGKVVFPVFHVTLFGRTSWARL